ncbi:hypothetical protein BZA05DRAFT_248067 [Tricharina praecox]|uniref:uncharacterized protein n=1 Tax=Tricharina praecox TaxID=43433 RepID=UPI002220BE0B|nr:uncharacterized protein BZA05DRAFT_248067 [Tricharina praecox]KAI5854714.1 hypothetical protein BZA05DRAFT_248067 [Tricharina praecox]
MASRPSTPVINFNLNSYGRPPSVRLSPPPPSPPAASAASAGEGSKASFQIVPHTQHGCGDPWAGETPPSTRPSTPRSICGRGGSWNGSSTSSTSSTTTTTTTATTTTATTPHGQGALDNVNFPDLDLLLLPSYHRLPPRPSELTDNSSTITATSPHRSRDPSPSRLSILASPLARIAARSLSSPLGLPGGAEKSPSTITPTTPSPSPRPGAAATLLANMFKTPDGSSAPSVKGGGFFGFKLPSTASPRNSRTIQSTDIIDEFAGLSFASLMTGFLTEPNPNETPSSPADALKRTPERRLEEAVATATDLLNRVYTAYRARTISLGDALGDLENSKDDIISHQTLHASLKTQLDSFITEERETAARLAEQQKRIAELESELQQERRKRETADDELRLSPRRMRCPSSKRTSAASDSGFESDVDSISILSRSDARASTVVSPTEEVDEEPDHPQPHPHHECESCRHQAAAAQGAETKNPTPLREAWSPDNNTNTNNTNNNRNSVPASKPGVWGFFKGRQQQQGNWGDVENVRMENRWLRERVREMEKAVDGALEAVAGRGVAL